MTLMKYTTVKIPTIHRTGKCQFCRNGATHVVIARFSGGTVPAPAVCGKHLNQLRKELESVIKKQSAGNSGEIKISGGKKD